MFMFLHCHFQLLIYMTSNSYGCWFNAELFSKKSRWYLKVLLVYIYNQVIESNNVEQCLSFIYINISYYDVNKITGRKITGRNIN